MDRPTLAYLAIELAAIAAGAIAVYFIGFDGGVRRGRNAIRQMWEGF